MKKNFETVPMWFYWATFIVPVLYCIVFIVAVFIKKFQKVFGTLFVFKKHLTDGHLEQVLLSEAVSFPLLLFDLFLSLRISQVTPTISDEASDEPRGGEINNSLSLSFPASDQLRPHTIDREKCLVLLLPPSPLVFVLFCAFWPAFHQKVSNKSRVEGSKKDCL